MNSSETNDKGESIENIEIVIPEKKEKLSSTSKTESLSNFSQKKLIAIIERERKEKKELLETIKEQANHIDLLEMEITKLNSKNEEFHVKLATTAVEMSKYNGKSPTKDEKQDKEPLEDYVSNLQNEVAEAAAVNISNSSLQDKLFRRVTRLEEGIEKRNKIIRALRVFSKNQVEEMKSLCILVNKLVHTMDKKHLTSEQELLIREFQISYSKDDDNSDVENTLEIDEETTPISTVISPGGSSIPLSPSPIINSPMDTMENAFTISSFLHYVSTCLTTVPFNPTVLTDLSPEGLIQIRSFLSSLLDDVVLLLTNGTIIRNWLPDSLFLNCYECDTPFSATNRKHHCRWCGRVFCSKCTTHRITWEAIGSNQRLCDHCYLLYTKLSTVIQDVASISS